MYFEDKNYWALIVLGLLAAQPLSADEPQKVVGVGLTEPVYRVTKQDTSLGKLLPVVATSTSVAPAPAKPKPHPLDAALAKAQQSLALIQADVSDYSAIMIKRERIGGELMDQQFMQTKIRNRKQVNGKVTTPFAVYLKFLKPENVKGREVIYLEGQNSGNIIAHEGGWKGKFTPSLQLNPHGALAMMGQRYPITDIGVENLCVRLIERGNRDKKVGDCQVTMQPAKINKRPCTRIQVTHQEKQPGLDFHIARVFVDDEFNVPVRYEAYDWPRRGAEVTLDDLIEEYTYVHMKLNVGLSDKDFDPANPKYNMQ